MLHTPWHVYHDFQHDFFYVVNVDGKKLATVYGNAEAKLAHADLFAAAPELLEALEAFLLPPDALFCDYCDELAETDIDGNIGGPIRHSIGCPDPIARLVIFKAKAKGEAT